MPPRKPSSAAGARTATPQAGTSSSGGPSTAKANDAGQIVAHVWGNYVRKTPPRVKLVDAFMAFLAAVGALQFVYCVLGGNYVRPPSPLSFSPGAASKQHMGGSRCGACRGMIFIDCVLLGRWLTLVRRDSPSTRSSRASARRSGSSS
jgi:hypothetical protein